MADGVPTVVAVAECHYALAGSCATCATHGVLDGRHSLRQCPLSVGIVKEMLNGKCLSGELKVLKKRADSAQSGASMPKATRNSKPAQGSKRKRGQEDTDSQPAKSKGSSVRFSATDTQPAKSKAKKTMSSTTDAQPAKGKAKKTMSSTTAKAGKGGKSTRGLR